MMEGKTQVRLGQMMEQAIKNCYMAHQYEYPEMEDGLCAGLRTLDGRGEPCEVCKECKLLYTYAWDDAE